MTDRLSADDSAAPNDGGLQPVRPTTRSRIRAGGLLALGGLLIVGALGAGAVAVSLTRSSAAGPPLVAPQFNRTGLVNCWGQRPGAVPEGQLEPSEACPVMAVPPLGYDAATWTLDPSMAFGPDATVLHILVDWHTCHGELSAEGRIVQNVSYGDAGVVVTLAVRSLQGAATCPYPPPTPYTLHLDEAVGSRALLDGGWWPPNAIARGGQPVVSPTPTPYPSSWHQPMDCSPDVDSAGFFKAAAMGTAFDLYCAVLPSGWSMGSKSGDEQGAALVVVTYKGPAGEVLTLQEGDICTKSGAECMAGHQAGTAMFGDREGILVDGLNDADFAVYVEPGKNPSWIASAKGMSLEMFKALTAGLILVGKW